MEAGEELREVEAFSEIDRGCVHMRMLRPAARRRRSDPFFSEGVSTKYRGGKPALTVIRVPPRGRSLFGSWKLQVYTLAVSSALALSCGTVSRPLRPYFLDIFSTHAATRWRKHINHTPGEAHVVQARVLSALWRHAALGWPSHRIVIGGNLRTAPLWSARPPSHEISMVDCAARA